MKFTLHYSGPLRAKGKPVLTDAATPSPQLRALVSRGTPSRSSWLSADPPSSAVRAASPRPREDAARHPRAEGSIVIKNVSGHLTDKMKDHYSTVDAEEQREGIGLVLSRVKSGGLTIVKERPMPESAMMGEVLVTATGRTVATVQAPAGSPSRPS